MLDLPEMMAVHVQHVLQESLKKMLAVICVALVDQIRSQLNKL